MTGEVWQISYEELTLRLVLAAFLGGVIGWEREQNNHPAGFRTHILVSVGSALIMLISIYGFSDFMHEPKVTFDPSRISAQVVSGIGFLGAGTILRQGLTVSGLTTAASLWVVAGIGLAVGAGFIFPAVITTLIAWISLELLNRWDAILKKRKKISELQIVLTDYSQKLGQLAALIAESGGEIRQVQVENLNEDRNEQKLSLQIRMENEQNIGQLLTEMRRVQGIREVRVE